MLFIDIVHHVDLSIVVIGIFLVYYWFRSCHSCDSILLNSLQLLSDSAIISHLLFVFLLRVQVMYISSSSVIYSLSWLIYSIPSSSLSISSPFHFSSFPSYFSFLLFLPLFLYSSDLLSPIFIFLLFFSCRNIFEKF